MYYLQPFEWTDKVAGDSWNEIAEPVLLDLSMPITFMTTLLITFHWQEVIRLMSKQDSLQVLKNLGIFAR